MTTFLGSLWGIVSNFWLGFALLSFALILGVCLQLIEEKAKKEEYKRIMRGTQGRGIFLFGIRLLTVFRNVTATIGVLFFLVDFVFAIFFVALADGYYRTDTKPLFGSYFLGVVDRDYHFTTKAENLYLDLTTGTTEEQRAEAQRKAEAKRVAEEELADFNRFNNSIPQDMLEGLSPLPVQAWKMAAGNERGYELIPVYETEDSYILITRDLQRQTIKKSDFGDRKLHCDGVICIKGRYIPAKVNMTSEDITFCTAGGEPNFIILSANNAFTNKQILTYLQ